MVGIFVMIFKKNDPDDCVNYRCIGLLNHGYKIMSIVLLQRLMTECDKFFSDWQAGFRPQRGCRDNILLLRIIYDQFIKGDNRFVVTYIDFKAAFDSVSHKYLDVALAAAGASRKSRAMVRAIYRAASGVAKVSGTHGKFIFSEPFDISRGVVQGDIISPILFILALDQLVRTHDVHGTGVKCGEELVVRVLGYADDASLLEPKVQDMSERLTSLADGAEADADMKVSIKKTFTQHVGKRGDIKISKEEAAAAQDSFSHKCDFCNRKFNSRKAMLLHRNSCIHQYNTTEEVFTVEDIVGVFDCLENRWLLVKWEDYEEPD